MFFLFLSNENVNIFKQEKQCYATFLTTNVKFNIENIKKFVLFMIIFYNNNEKIAWIFDNNIFRGFRTLLILIQNFKRFVKCLATCHTPSTILDLPATIIVRPCKIYAPMSRCRIPSKILFVFAEVFLVLWKYHSFYDVATVDVFFDLNVTLHKILDYIFLRCLMKIKIFGSFVD